MGIVVESEAWFRKVSAAAAKTTSENLGWLRITLLMDCLGLKFLLLKDRETEWWSKSSVEISTEISHLERKNSRVRNNKKI